MHINKTNRSDIFLARFPDGSIASRSHQKIICLVGTNHAAYRITMVFAVFTRIRNRRSYCVISLGGDEPSAYILQRALMMRLSTFTRLAMVHVRQETSRLAIDAGLHSTLLSHRLEYSLWVCLHSETDLVVIVLVPLSRPETHIVQLLISSSTSNSLKSRLVVHVDI